jgi:hypothetical protein
MKEKKKIKMGLIRDIIIHEKTFSVVAVSVLIITFLFISSSGLILAEQEGSTPDSGVTSRINSLNSDLADLGFGSTSNSPDWGSLWNRIVTSAKWVPNGTATASDVISGKTFYNTSRASVTGTYPKLTGCSTQLYTDSDASSSQTNNCNVTWSSPSGGVTGDDKKDPRTGLVWSYPLYNNGSALVFSSSNSTAVTWYNPINGVGNVSSTCSGFGNGWRLPAQKELMQAYVDGAYYNLTNPTTSRYWTSINGPTYWSSVNLSTGEVGFGDWRLTYLVRCVR